MNDRIVRLAIAVVPFVGIVGTLVATLVDALIRGGDLGRDLLENSVLWMIGVQGWMTGCGHMFFGEPVAESMRLQ